MKPRINLFLKWWLIFIIILVSSFFTYKIGLYNTIFAKDESYICIVIFAIFYFMSVWCELKTWKISKSLTNPDNFDDFGALIPEKRKELERLVEVGWFTSDLCLTLGMAGTIIGFIFMLSGFETFNVADPTSIQKLLSDLGKSMATALYTTIVGLVCGQLLKFQYFNLTQELREE